MTLVTVNAPSIDAIAGSAEIDYGVTHPDRRFKSWAKHVTPATFRPSKENGYSLTGHWIKWGETVALEPGQGIVIANETGSARNHSYSYALIWHDADAPRMVTPKEARDAIRASDLPDAFKAKALNNPPYAFGLYAVLMSRPAEPAAEPAYPVPAQLCTQCDNDLRERLIGRSSASLTRRFNLITQEYEEVRNLHIGEPYVWVCGLCGEVVPAATVAALMPPPAEEEEEAEQTDAAAE